MRTWSECEAGIRWVPMMDMVIVVEDVFECIIRWSDVSMKFYPPWWVGKFYAAMSMEKTYRIHPPILPSLES